MTRPFDGPLPEPPAGTAELFGDAWATLLSYARLLADLGIRSGVIGPRELPRIWERHIRNSLAVSPFIEPGAHVLDLGSGAGLPGIPLALARPDLTVTLVEPLARRVRFLNAAVSTCGLPVTVDHARAEGATKRGSAVVARAVAPLPRLLPLTRDLLINGAGRLVALKGASAADEVATVKGTRGISWRPDHIEVHRVSWPDPATVVTADWKPTGRRRDR